MKEWMSLEDPLAFKALAHPMRVTILHILTKKQASVNDIANELEMVHAKVHYHVMTLLKSNLIEQVGSSVKNGIVEKFYRTVAKTFFIGHAIGENTELTTTALSAVENNILKHRREDLLEVSLPELANKIIVENINIKPESCVLIEGDDQHQELLKALALECRVNGSEALMRYISLKHYFNEVQCTDVNTLKKQPPFTTTLYQNVDYWITIGTLIGRGIFAKASKEKISAWKEGMIKAINSAHHGLKSIIIDCPNREWASELGINYTAVHDSFWQALSCPTVQLNDIAKKLIANLTAKRIVRYEGKDNSFLEFELLKKREVLINDGQLKEGLKEDFDVDLFLPGGKISFAPKEYSINGEVNIPRLFFRSRIITDIKLVINNSKIVSFDAGEYEDEFKTILNNKSGDTIGSLSIGFNPEVHDDIYFNTIMPNYITLGVGRNDFLGGDFKDNIPMFLCIGEMKLK